LRSPSISITFVIGFPFDIPTDDRRAPLGDTPRPRILDVALFSVRNTSERRGIGTENASARERDRARLHDRGPLGVLSRLRCIGW
jgi:hypothetical protein